MESFNNYINQIKEPRREGVLHFHNKNIDLIKNARGSNFNHQAWQGGYLDHIYECFKIADNIYKSLSKIRMLPFSFDSALVVLYFHDIEKIWKHTTGEIIDKQEYYEKNLSLIGVYFSEEEKNALHYIHGENESYSNNRRTMNELAAFCHSVDTMSARMWYNEGKGTAL